MRIFKNGVFRIVLTTFNLIIPVITGMYIARLLDVEVFGEFNKANSLLALFMMFCNFGIYDYGIREIGKVQNNKTERDSIFTSLFTIGFITNVIGLVLFLIYTLFFVQSYQSIYYILLINIFSNIFNIEWINEGLENYKFITIKTILIRIVYIILLFLLVKKPDDVYLYTLLLSLTLFFNNIVSFFYLKKRVDYRLSLLNVKKHLKKLIVMTFIININFLYIQLDKVMLGQYINGSAVSAYQIPLYITETIFNVLLSILVVTIPKLSFFSHNNLNDKYCSLLKKSTDLFYLIAIPATIGMICLSKEIIILYGGNKYLYVVPVMAIMCIYKLFGSFDYILSQQILYIKNKQNILMIFVLIGGVLNVICGFLMIYLGIFSAYTSIIKTTIVEMIVILIMNYYIKHKINLQLKIINKSKLTYLLISFGFFPISYVIRLFTQNILVVSFLCILICLIFYLVCLILLKEKNTISCIETIGLKLKNSALKEISKK